MSMRKRITIIFLLIFCAALASCADVNDFKKPTAADVPTSGMNVKKTALFPMFNSVSLRGPFNVKIHTAPDPNQPNNATITLSGDSGLIDTVTYFVKNQTLTMFVSPDYTYSPYNHINVDIRVPAINRLYIIGPGKVDISHLNVSHLRVIGQGSAHITLAGYANRMDATLTGTSRLNAKCLHTKTIFVNTTEKAQAEVLNNDGGIGGLATAKSDIYYYESPDMVAPYERQSGSIMRMKGIAPPYNKPPQEKPPEDKVVEALG